MKVNIGPAENRWPFSFWRSTTPKLKPTSIQGRVRSRSAILRAQSGCERGFGRLCGVVY